MTADLSRAREVVAGLTKAQRRWLKEGAHADIGIGMVRRLIALGLWYIQIDSPNGRCGFAKPTPLGLQVRAILAESDGGVS